MNRIYKVVFNKARNCYVVASEIAKSHTKSSTSKSAKTAALLCAAALSLGVSVSAADTNVIYDDSTKAQITLRDDGGTTDILGVTGGQVYENSNYAANGNDVYQVSQKVDKFSGTLDKINTNISSINALVSANTNTLATIKSTTDTLNQKVARGYIAQVDGADVKNVTPSDNELNFKSGNNVKLTADNGSVLISVTAEGKVAKGNTGLVTGDTVNTAIEAEKTAREAADTAIKNDVIGSISKNGNYVKTGNTVYGNISALDTQVKANADAIGAETTARTTAITNEAKARKDADDALTAKIGSLDADGSYITAASSVTGNLSALDTQVKANANAIGAEKTAREDAIKGLENKINNQITNLDGNSVQYTDATKEKVKLAGAGGTTITNVKAGALSKDSTDAVNGAQLFETNTNLTNETKAREAADAAINTKLGSMTADGTYVKAADSVASGLTKLDSQTKKNTDDIASEIKNREEAVTNLKTEITNNINNLSGNAVQYKDDTKSSIELGGKGGTTITNLKAGNLAQGSTDAVTGDQLFTTNTNLANETKAREAADTALTNKIGSIAEDGSYIKAQKSVFENLSSLDSQTKKNTDGLAQEVKDRQAAVDAINGTIGTLTDGTYVKAGDTVASGLSKLDAQTKKNTDDIATETQKREEAVTNLKTEITNNINNLAGNAVQYKDATKGVVEFGGEGGTTLKNVKAGTLSADSTEAVNGAQLYDANTRINKNLATIRNLNASLTSVRNTAQSNSSRIDSLNDTIVDINTNVTANMANVSKMLANAANTDLSNLSEDGNATIAAAARSAVQDYMKQQAQSASAKVKSAASTMQAVYSSPVAVQSGGEAVTYDNSTKSQITLADGERTTDIVGVTGGQVYEDSTYAANGNDVWQVSQKVDKFSSTLDKINTNISSINAVVGENTNTLSKTTAIANTNKQKLDRGYNININGITVKNATPNDNNINLKSGDNVTLTEDNSSIKLDVKSDGVIGKGNTGLISGDTAFTALEEKANKDLSNLTDEAKQQIKNTMSSDMATKANVGLDNLSDAGVQKVKDIMASDMANKADINMSNLSTDGVNKIKALAKGAVKFADGDGTSVASSFDEDGNVTYKVNVDDQKIKDTMSEAMATKADVDAKNLNVSKYAEKLGTGSISEGEKNLVNGDTVFNAIKDLKGTTDTNLTTKVDVNMTNITSEGKTVIKGLAQDAVKIASGTNSNVTSAMDEDGNLTYTVDVAANGTIEEGNTGLISGDTAKKALDKKANVDLDNLSEAGMQKIKDTMTADMAMKAEVDASNVGKYATEWAKAIGTGKIEKGNQNLVTGDVVYGAVSIKADKSYVDTELGKKADQAAMDTALAGKADNNLGNLTEEGKANIKEVMKDDLAKKADKTYVDNALAGKVDKSEFNTVKDQVEKNTETIATKADKTYVDDKLATKADADKVYTKEEVNSKIDTVKNTISGDMENKVNKDASNIEKDKWQAALGDGVNEKGNTGLINGDTLHTALDDLKKDGVGIVRQDGDTITVGKDTNATKVSFSGTDDKGNTINRVLTGIKTDESDATSATNVGYVQGVASDLQNEMDYMNNRLTDDIKEAGAVSAALAGLHHIDYDPDNKLDFAVATAGYRGKSAMALGAFYQPNENIMFSLGGTLGSKHNAWNLGLSFKVGQGSDSPVLSRRVLGNRINALAADNQAKDEKIDQLEQNVKDMQRQLAQLLANAQLSETVQKDMTASK